MAKMALLLEEFRQDVRDVTRTDCTQIAKVALLSAGFRQDVREVTRTDCSLMAKIALLSEEFRQDVREVTRTNWIEKTEILTEELRQGVHKSWTCFSILDWDFSWATCWLRDLKIVALFVWPTLRKWTLSWKSWLDVQKSWGQSTLRKIDILSEEFRQDVKKCERSPPWQNGELVWRVPTGSQKIVSAVHLEKMEIVSEVGRVPTGCPNVLDLLFNIQWAVLLSHLLVARF